MIIPDSKKIAVALISKMKDGKLGSDTPVKPEAQTDEDSKPLHAAAEDMLAAIKAGSASELADALKAAFELCDSYEDSEESDKSDESADE